MPNKKQGLLEEFEGLIDQISKEIINSALMGEIKENADELEITANEVEKEIKKFKSKVDNKIDQFDQSTDDAIERLYTLKRKVDELEEIVNNLEGTHQDYSDKMKQVNDLLEKNKAQSEAVVTKVHSFQSCLTKGIEEEFSNLNEEIDQLRDNDLLEAKDEIQEEITKTKQEIKEKVADNQQKINFVLGFVILNTIISAVTLFYIFKG
jgi:ABC-type transporter Mla subunit MlaD